MIVGILGSAAAPSSTRAGLTAVGNQLRSYGVEFALLDLGVEFRRPHHPAEYRDPGQGSQTALLRDRLATASGFVLGTPVYHGSYSGLLKNALDHLLSDAFAGRPVGLLANGGGPRGAAVACDQLCTVVRALGGWAVPTHVSTTTADFTHGQPSQDVLGRIETMVDQMLLFLDRTRPLAVPAGRA
ncbi:NADPH-dependent FMN reductase [Kitasatospora sp. GP82]|uniref:NADPH-dependent FMN reductase n=1 Tax=Kitasatospora sp. GP82 TaxID=3035089 RepID=UPI002473C60E|nr:NADPH-dependent FMN reductase [Kitasatospora sp. GP82]MDH6129703.1 NAD(P)H-dependent FMN reductase [Kitasatospora sp. GP82]